MRNLLTVLLLLALIGCSKQPKIQAEGVSVMGSKDVNNVTLNTDKVTESIALPADTKITVTEKQAKPAVISDSGDLVEKSEPAATTTEITLKSPSEWRKNEVSVKADTGTIDTTVAIKRINAEESRVLLYASGVAFIAACVFLYLKFPTPALLCGGAAVVFFLAWKLSDLPTWTWVAGAIAVCAGLFLYFGYEKGAKSSKNEAN